MNVLREDVLGASLIVGLRLAPRAALAVLAGVTFQTLLRNPLASPDIIGIAEGASATAIVAIVTFGLSGWLLSVMAVTAGLGVAFIVYLFAYRHGVADTRLTLIGIAVAALMQCV